MLARSRVLLIAILACVVPSRAKLHPTHEALYHARARIQAEAATGADRTRQAPKRNRLTQCPHLGCEEGGLMLRETPTRNSRVLVPGVEVQFGRFRTAPKRIYTSHGTWGGRPICESCWQKAREQGLVGIGSTGGARLQAAWTPTAGQMKQWTPER